MTSGGSPDVRGFETYIHPARKMPESEDENST